LEGQSAWLSGLNAVLISGGAVDTDDTMINQD